MLSGTLITCAGFLPLALAQGMVAEFTKSLSIVVFMALILSWFASVLVSPVLGYKIIENKAPKPESEWTKRDRIMHKLNVTFYDKFEKTITLGTRTSQGSLIGYIRCLSFYPCFHYR